MGRNPNFVSHSINRHGSLIEKKVMTIAQQLKIKEYPFIIKDNRGNQIYYETSDGYWSKKEYDDEENQSYFEDSNRYWVKREFDDKGNQIYYEDSFGRLVNDRPKSVPEYTMQELVDKLGHNFKIKK